MLNVRRLRRLDLLITFRILNECHSVGSVPIIS